jgi:hypothetical protein
MKLDHWLRCEKRSPSSTLCFAVAFVGTRVAYGAPWAMGVIRSRRLFDVRRFREWAESRGFVCTVLRGHDGPCCLLPEWGMS